MKFVYPVYGIFWFQLQ